MGRPSKLNDELIELFASKVRKGLSFATVCDLLEIHQTTYEDWNNKGEEDNKANIDSLYATFSRAIKKAYAQFLEDSNEFITYGKPGWQGRAWWLERTNSKFMPKQQVTADEDGKVTVVIGGKEKKVKQ